MRTRIADSPRSSVTRTVTMRCSVSGTCTVTSNGGSLRDPTGTNFASNRSLSAMKNSTLRILPSASVASAVRITVPGRVAGAGLQGHHGRQVLDADDQAVFHRRETVAVFGDGTQALRAGGRRPFEGRGARFRLHGLVVDEQRDLADLAVRIDRIDVSTASVGPRARAHHRARCARSAARRYRRGSPRALHRTPGRPVRCPRIDALRRPAHWCLRAAHPATGARGNTRVPPRPKSASDLLVEVRAMHLAPVEIDDRTVVDAQAQREIAQQLRSCTSKRLRKYATFVPAATPVMASRFGAKPSGAGASGQFASS
jgi:hypothetical protein